MSALTKVLVSDTFNELSSRLTDLETIKAFASTLEGDSFKRFLNNIRAIFDQQKLKIKNILIFPNLELVLSELVLKERDIIYLEYLSQFKNLKYATIRLIINSLRIIITAAEKFIKERSKFNVIRDFLITDGYEEYTRTTIVEDNLVYNYEEYNGISIVGDILFDNLYYQNFDQKMLNYGVTRFYERVYSDVEIIFDSYILEFDLRIKNIAHFSLRNLEFFFEAKHIDYVFVHSTLDQKTIEFIKELLKELWEVNTGLGAIYENLLTMTIPVYPDPEIIDELRTMFPNVKEFSILGDYVDVSEINKIDKSLNYKMVYLEKEDENKIIIHKGRRNAMEYKAGLPLINGPQY